MKDIRQRIWPKTRKLCDQYSIRGQQNRPLGPEWQGMPTNDPEVMPEEGSYLTIIADKPGKVVKNSFY